MFFTNFSRIVKYGFSNYYRNLWQSVAATLVMTFTLFIMSTVILFQLIGQATADDLKERIDIIVNFKDSTSENDIQVLNQQLLARPDVKSVHYISKDEAYQRWLTTPSIKPEVKGIITRDNNPLPRGLQIKAANPDDIKLISEFINQPRYKPLIYSSTYEADSALIDKLNMITKFITKVGFGLAVIFVIVSIIVIFNTIRIAIVSRRNEVEIMRLVGAPDKYIRIPFIIEGALTGVIATVIAMGLLGLGAWLLNPLAARYLGSSQLGVLNFYFSNFLKIVGLQLAVGVLIGVIASLFSIRRNLRV